MAQRGFARESRVTLRNPWETASATARRATEGAWRGYRPVFQSVAQKGPGHESGLRPLLF